MTVGGPVKGIGPDAEVKMRAEDLQIALCNAERRGAVKALRNEAVKRDVMAESEGENLTGRTVHLVIAAVLHSRADAIENGCDL